MLIAMMPGMGQAKTLKVALDADPVSLDPHVQLSGGMLQYSHIVFDPLVRWTQDGKFEPRLATSWEQKDDLTTRFHLRKGVKFHSGNEFTAKDVAWTIARLKQSQDYKFLFELFAGAEVVDKYTVDIKTTKPYGLVLAMSTYIFPMDSAFYTGTDEAGQPKDAIVKTGPSFALTNESGTGPFAVTFREQGVKTVFTRFKDYWDKQVAGQRRRDRPDPHQGRGHPRGGPALGRRGLHLPGPPAGPGPHRRQRQAEPGDHVRHPGHHPSTEPEAP